MKKLSKLLSIVLVITLFINTVSVQVNAEPSGSTQIPEPVTLGKMYF